MIEIMPAHELSQNGLQSDAITWLQHAEEVLVILVSQAVTWLTMVLQVIFILAYFWERRARLIEAVTALPRLYWTLRYRRAVTRWQAEAPVMLEHHPIVILEQREGQWQLRK